MHHDKRSGFIVTAVAFGAALLALALALPSPLSADVRLPAIISDHMVLQQDLPVSIWGWAGRGEGVTVQLAGQEIRTKASADGRWQVSFPPLKAAATPLELHVIGERGPDLLVRDILVGEVWVCSGQSNMEWPVEALTSPIPEILRAGHPQLRLFLVPRRTSSRPEEDIDAKWAPSTSESVRSFSAVAYFYGLELQEKLNVPVGLVESAWGGTDIEPWTPPAGFAALPELKTFLDRLAAKVEDYRAALGRAIPIWDGWVHEADKAVAAKSDVPPKPRPDFPADPYDDPQAPTTLYNGMIHALTPYTIRGAIWYQGENNRNDGLLYEKKMEALIRGWREVWKLGDFPFYYVQLAPFNYGTVWGPGAGDAPDFLRLPLIWEAQTNILRLPNTGMAVTTDITNLNDIHPRDKKDVASRLALWALARTYGEKEVVPSGPLFKSMSVEGAQVRIFFDYSEGGLITNDGRPLSWFEIAGDDHIFYKAEAEISGDTVIVKSARVTTPVAVRFGWSQFAVPNLANKEGLPASPFRTDRW